jgi:outer membrane autotransporter protein
MQGSTLTNSNSGQVTGGGFGSLVKAKNIILNNSTIVNDGNILTDMLSIDPSSTYSGNGFISNLTPSTTLVVTNNGTVLPGDAGIGGAPATMTIDGSYVQTPTGTLVIDFDNATSYSKLMITGSAQLAGTMEVAETLDANIIPGQIFQVLQANGGVTGTFSTFVDFNIPYAAPHAIYFPNSVEIFFTPITQNYINLSRPIFSSVNETYTRLTREMERVRLRFTKPKEEKVSISKKQTSSAWYDEAPRYVAFQEDVVSEEKRERLTESMEVGKERPGNFYIGPKGQVGNVVSKEDMQGYSYWTAGVFTGFDYAFSEIGIGLLAEYERVEADIGKKWGKFDIDTAHVDAYATYAPSGLSELSFNAIVGGGYEWYKLKRNINQTVPHTLKGAPRGAEWDALFGMEYSFRDSVFTAMPERLQIIPMASVEYMYLHISDYTEHGFQPHALHVSKQNVKSLRSNLGFRISYIWHRTENITIYPQVNFNWQREYLDKERNIDFLPVEFSDFGFSLDLPKVGRNTALAGIDVLLTMFQRHGLEAGYDFEYNPVYHTHFLYLSYNLRF